MVFGVRHIIVDGCICIKSVNVDLQILYFITFPKMRSFPKQERKYITNLTDMIIIMLP